MPSDGKQLEALVSFVESALLPEGFDVKTRERVYNDEGVQIAEFDIEIRGKLGSGTIAWLIECRDRPGDGPAPGSWIEQLVGRRTRFGFNMITAVSTTGFSAGAAEFATDQDIEMREVKALEPEAFSDWLLMQHMHQRRYRTKLDRAFFLVNEADLDDEGHRTALKEAIEGQDGNAKLLKKAISGERVSAASAFDGAVRLVDNIFDQVEPNTPGKQVTLNVQYTGEHDHFVIETTSGPFRVDRIIFQGKLIVREALVPISRASEYRTAESGETISQVVSFSDETIGGSNLALEFHKIAETGETHVLLRKTSSRSNQNLEEDG